MLSKKKILVFIDWYLPGYKAGGPIQSCANLIAHLCDEFDFYIVTRDSDYCETQAYQGIRSNEWNTLKDGSKVFYISHTYLSASLIKKICRETDFDYAYINGVYSFYFSILPLYYLRTINRIKIIVASRGMLAQSAIKVKSAKKSLFLLASKIMGLYNQVTFQASTLDEVKDIKYALGVKTKIILAGNLPKKYNSGSYPVKEKIEGRLKLINIARDRKSVV